MISTGRCAAPAYGMGMIVSFITAFIIYFVAIHPLAISLLVGPSAIILAGLSVQYVFDGLAAIGLIRLA